MKLLREWLSAERGRVAGLAKHLSVPSSYVSCMASGKKPIPVEHGWPIEQFTANAVTRRAMFPDRWRVIWPELADPDGASTDDACNEVANV